MATTHRNFEAGGHPAAGPHPDVANPTPKPAVGNEFPDDPSDGSGREPDQPDLDAFAARIGTDGLESGTSERTGRDWTAIAASAVGGLSHGAQRVAGRLASAAARLAPGETDGELDLADLHSRISDVDTVMLTTVDERGTLSSRPLTVQRVLASGDVDIVVARDAEWVSGGIDAANVAFVDGPRTWVSVAGRATVLDDQALLDELWSRALDSFFPNGRPSAVVLRVHADRWDYWTAPNSARQLVEIVGSTLTDSPPDLGTSGTVET